MEKSNLELLLSPFKFLNEIVEKYRDEIQFDRYTGSTSSWVYGVSSNELQDLGIRYENLKIEIENTIDRIDNQFLRNKLFEEFEMLPDFKYLGFIIDTDNVFWFLCRIINPIKRTKKTVEFKSIIEEIYISSKRMIHYIENQEWLELIK